MDIINWEKYKADEFQLFCNALLSFEIGKSYRPFMAPGRDSGIDGWFEGVYEGREGKWRFQDKFHKTARKTAVSSLKIDLKKEIAKIKDEQVLVLLTNVDLLPKEQEELFELFKSEKPDRDIFFELWDGGKLFTLSLKYPLLWLWLDEGFKTAQLLEYQTAFAKELSNSIGEAFTFNNKFSFREDVLAQLNQFFSSANSKVALITGEAGIGKTRLIVEFFKQLELNGAEVVCLVLTNKNIDFDRLTKALSGPKKILILIDDAHEYDPKVIADLNALIANPTLSVQIILTARDIQSYNSTRLIKEYQQIKITRINLRELTRDETRVILADELKNHYLSNFLNELTNITHGKPILIVAVLRAAFNNIRIELIKNDDFLNSYVHNYFTSLTEQITNDTLVPKIKAVKLLQLICLLEPFSYNDPDILKRIADFLKVETETIDHVFKLLIQGSFVSGRFERSIKPDYYSDIILKNAENNLIEEALQQFPSHTQNIIANLASADEIENSNNTLLPKILENYIQPVRSGADLIAISRILDTVRTVSYFKPELAKKTAEIYLTAIEDKGSALYKVFQQGEKDSFFGNASDIGNVIGIFSQLLDQRKYFEFVYHSVFRLFEALRETKPLLPVFQFSKRDYLEKFNLSRQLFFIGELREEVNGLSGEKLLFVIEFLKSFMNLDFADARINGTGSHSITVTTYYLPRNSKVKKLRCEIIDLLTEIFRSSNDDKIKENALELLLDIPRGISATKRNSTPYKGDDEIEMILKFLKEEAANVAQAFQKEILDKLYWYIKWKINPDFELLIEEIKVLLTPRNLTEEIIQLLAESEHRADLNKVEKQIRVRLRKIYDENSVETITESLTTIFHLYGNKLYNFYLAISTLADDYPELAKQVYYLLVERAPEFIYQWGSSILKPIKYKHKDIAFYRSEIERLTAENSYLADNVILENYGTHHASKTIMEEKDFEIIGKILAKRDPRNYYSLVRPLIVFVVQRPEQGRELCMKFLSACHYQEADHFFIFLSDNLVESYDQAKYLALNATTRFGLSYSMERCLNEVLRRGETDLIYDYLMTRVAYKIEGLKENKSLISYELVPDGKHTYLFEGVNDEVRIGLFNRLIVWFCKEKLESFAIYYLQDLFEYFNKESYITEQVFELFDKLIKEFEKDKTGLIRILEIITIYHVKNVQLLQMVENIYTKVIALGSSDNEYINDLNSKAYQALVQSGVKSGTVGQPFQIDLDLKEILTKYLEKLSGDSLFQNVVISALRSVETNIEYSTDRDNETW